MKTQTAKEFYHEKTKFGAPLTTNAEILNEFATTQIEALRERLVNEFSLSGQKIMINHVFNEFLKEINDGK
jgi:hypothetical protein